MKNYMAKLRSMKGSTKKMKGDGIMGDAWDYIKKGAPLLTLHTDEPARFERALEILDGAIAIVENGKVERLPLVLERITG